MSSRTRPRSSSTTMMEQGPEFGDSSLNRLISRSCKMGLPMTAAKRWPVASQAALGREHSIVTTSLRLALVACRNSSWASRSSGRFRMAAAGRSRDTASSTCAGVATGTNSYSSMRRIRYAEAMPSSPTIRTVGLSRRVRGVAWPRVSLERETWTSPSGSVKAKTLPFPTSLRAQILPPCRWTNLLAIAKPRPLPPSDRVRSRPTCWNSSKMASSSPAGMPQPVVLHRYLHFTLPPFQPDVDTAAVCVADGVAEKVVEHLANADRVHRKLGQVRRTCHR